MFGKKVEIDIKQHANSEYPKECCGIVNNDTYIPLENLADDPENDFRIYDKVWVDYPNLQAIIHSHIFPLHSRGPSGEDMRAQMRTAVPWGIVLTDGRNCRQVDWLSEYSLDLPLLNREFVHGITDCYSIIRAWYWQEWGIKLLDFPRDPAWWHNGENLYDEGFSKTGFEEIPLHEAKYGDVLLGSVLTTKTNHGAILLEKGLILHHLEQRTSRREPFNRWRKHLKRCLRYKG